MAEPLLEGDPRQLGGYWLAGAALRPIEAMRRRAAEISTTSLDERLPVAETRDEVSRLGDTLNEMLARIEAGVLRERRFVADEERTNYAEPGSAAGELRKASPTGLARSG